MSESNTSPAPPKEQATNPAVTPAAKPAVTPAAKPATKKPLHGPAAPTHAGPANPREQYLFRLRRALGLGELTPEMDVLRDAVLRLESAPRACAKCGEAV